MEFDPKTFCAAPWFQLRNENFGEYSPCAVLDTKKTQYTGCTKYSWPTSDPNNYLNSDYSTYLRQQLTSGVALPECHHCWRQENAGQESPRKSINNIVTGNNGIEGSWITSYLKRKTDYSHDHLIAADVKLTNVCNFACAMCYPGDSSQLYSMWHKDQQHPVIQILMNQQPDLLDKIKKTYQDKNNHRLLKLMVSKTPKFLKILGGEPLLDRVAIEILQSVEPEDQKKIELLFITNGSVNLYNTAKDLSGYRGINFVVSLDATEAVQDYIRRGSNWKNIEQNIDQWLSYRSNITLDIHVTIQALNIMHMIPLHNWANDRGIKVSLGILQEPNFMSLSAVPPSIRRQVPEKFQTLFESATYDPTLVGSLKSYLDWYDPEHKWCDILPEWKDYLC